MHFNPNIHHRQSIRLPGYDYASPGAYFVTMVTKYRECVFGDVANRVMVLNDLGRIIDREWRESPIIRPEMFMDAWVIMPNHVHGIVWITDHSRVGAHGRAPLHGEHGERRPYRSARSLSSFVAGFKSAATTGINTIRATPGIPVWQRNYHEHVIRSETELNRIRQYIIDNPVNWPNDENNKHPC